MDFGVSIVSSVGLEGNYRAPRVLGIGFTIQSIMLFIAYGTNIERVKLHYES
jgi:hypothetical protein